MNGQKQVGRRLVGMRHPLHQSSPGPAFSDQQHRLVEAATDQFLLDHLGQPKIEIKFMLAASAGRPECLGGVPDVQNETEG